MQNFFLRSMTRTAAPSDWGREQEGRGGGVVLQLASKGPTNQARPPAASETTALIQGAGASVVNPESRLAGRVARRSLIQTL